VVALYTRFRHAYDNSDHCLREVHADYVLLTALVAINASSHRENYITPDKSFDFYSGSLKMMAKDCR
jgi:hypothetical protein